MRRYLPRWLLALQVWCLALTWPLQRGLAATETSVDYTLLAHLPEDGHVNSLRGEGTVVLTNGTSVNLHMLSFHLYMNAYREGSLALTSAARGGRAAIRGGGPAGIDVHTLRDLRNDQLLPLEFPTQTEDRTTASVRLTAPLPPGETASFAITWTTSFPHLVQRTGHVRDYLFAGQWFPKLAKLEPDGTFAQFLFHPQGEFYANFGDYDVSIDAPNQFVIAATGVEMASQESSGRVRKRFLAKKVIDHAWSAWPEYQTHTLQLNATTVRAYFPPAQARNAQLTLHAVERALDVLQSWLGPYPYEALTVVHPPPFAANAGGMEYPTLITTGGAWHQGYWSNAIEIVTTHELAHQWFYGLLASNEYAWPFLDEGFATFAEGRAVAQLLHSRWERFHFRTASAAQRQRALLLGHDLPIALGAADFPNFEYLAALAYERAALVLDTLERVYGEAFQRALVAYAREHRFAHPGPEQWLQVLTEHVGPAAAVAARIAYFERGWVNYRMSSITHEPPVLASPKSDSSSRHLSSRLLVTRQGTLQLPVSIEFYDDQGQRHVEQWDGRAPTWEHVHHAPVVRACVDPARSVTLDENLVDNCLTRKPQPRSWLLASLSTMMQLILLAAAW